MEKNNNIDEVNTSLSEESNQAKREEINIKISSLTSKQKAAVAFGMVLLGGTSFIAVKRDEKGKIISPSPSTNDSNNPDAVENPNLAVGQTHEVAGGTLCPCEEVTIAQNVTDIMTFSDAFSAAREEAGPGSLFIWNGEVYCAFYNDEWSSLPLENRQEYLASIGYSVNSEPSTTPTASEPSVQSNGDNEPNVTPSAPELSIQSNGDNEPSTTPSVPEPSVQSSGDNDIQPNITPQAEKPDVREVMIGGNYALAIDSDNDGTVDSLIYAENGQIMALIDANGNNALDTLAVLDENTHEIIESMPLESPIDVSMASLETLGSAHDDTAEIAENQTPANAEIVDYSATDEEDLFANNEDYSNNDNVNDME